MLDIKDCSRCRLHKNRTQVVSGRGSKDAILMFVAEAPGATEDEIGKALVGRSGKKHDKLVRRAGINEGEYYNTNICRCRPPGNREPQADEIDACIENLFKEIDIIKPKAIVLLGGTALRAWFEEEFTSVTKMFGERYDDYNTAVFCAYHPSYLLRNPEFEEQQANVYERAMIYAKEGYDLREKVMNDIRSFPEEDQENEEKEFSIFKADETKENVVNAWSKDNTIYLLKKLVDGSLKVVSRRFEYYVLIRKRDYNAIVRMDKNAFNVYVKKGLITKIKEDESSKAWMRFYINLRGYMSREVVKDVAYEDRPPHPGLKLFREIETDYGVKIYEADLDPPTRYLIDNNIGYYPYENYKMLFADIETDDEGGMNVGNMRIYSIAWKSIQTGEQGFDWADSATDKHEKELLKRFKKVAEEYDIILAWNGDQFDFPEIIERSEIHGIYWDHKRIMFLDHMKVFDQFYQKSEGKITSLSLDNVSKVVLGEDRGKINIGFVCGKCKKESLEFGLCECGGFKRKKKMTELYREWLAEENDMLKDYNSEDVELMVDIEKKTGLIETLVNMNFFSGIRANIMRPSPKIDSLMLRTGSINGVRFKTKFGKGEQDATFMGAYVLPSEAGFHDSVAVLDFASMYPSIYQTFNICPTTLVPEWNADKYKPSELISTPESLCLKKGCAYVMKEWEENQYCPKCKSGPMQCHPIKFLKNKEGFVPNISRWTAEERNRLRRIQNKYKVGTSEYMDYERRAYAMKQLGLCFYGDLGNIYSRFYYPEIAGSITKIGRFVLYSTIDWLRQLSYDVVLGDTDSTYIKPQESVFDYDSMEDYCDAVNIEVNEVLEHYRGFIDALMSRYNISNNQIELEFETIYSPMLIAEAKKRYAGTIVWRKGEVTSLTEIKGLEAIRSDQLPIAQKMQRHIIDMILNRKGLGKILNYIKANRDKIIYGKLPIEHVVISKGLSTDTEGYYGDVIDSKTGKPKVRKDGTIQKKSIPAHVRVAEWIRQEGREYYVGMKVPYVVISATPKLLAIHAEDYYPGEFETKDDILNYECEAASKNDFGFDLEEYLGGYDPQYYWDRATFPCLERLLSVAYPDFDWKTFYLKEEAKAKVIYNRHESKLRSVKTTKGLESGFRKSISDERLTKEYVTELKRFFDKRYAELNKEAEKKPTKKKTTKKKEVTDEVSGQGVLQF